MACSTASAKYNNVAMSTRAEVEEALAGRDTSESDIRASFRRAFSFSIPPPTLYRNYCPGAHSDSGLIFGVPLVDVETDQDNVPDVMRICIGEVEKRGLDTKGIYSVSHVVRVPGFMYSCIVTQMGYSLSPQVLQVSLIHPNDQLKQLMRMRMQLRQRLESEKSFSLRSTDSIHSIAMLLMVSHCSHYKRVNF